MSEDGAPKTQVTDALWQGARARMPACLRVAAVEREDGEEEEGKGFP